MRRPAFSLLLLGACCLSTARIDAAPRGSTVQQLRQRHLHVESLLDLNPTKKKKEDSESAFDAQDHSDDDDKSDKKEKKNKSPAPSVAPTASPAPTISSPPSSQPSVPPTPAPTRTPSSPPSRQPSVPPTPAPTRTPSQRPSPLASESPTLFPTGRPSHSPTRFPTPMPSEPPSPAPTPAPTNPVRNPITTTTRNAEGDILIMNTHCSGNLPASASPITEQLVEFQYKLTLQSGVNAEIASAYIERKLQRNMTAILLECAYDGVMPFELSGLSSAPIDTLVGTCPEGATAGNDCYMVKAGLTASLFYTARDLQVQDQILDMRVVEELGPYLDSVFDSGWLSGPYEEIVSMDFDGFTNIYTGDSTYEDGNSEGASVAGINSGGQTALDDGSKVPTAFAAVAVAIAAIVLAIVVAVAVRRRRQEKPPPRHQKYDEDFEGDRNLSYDTDPVSPDSHVRGYEQYTYDDNYYNDDEEEPSVGLNSFGKKSVSTRNIPLHEKQRAIESSVYVDHRGRPLRFEEDPASRYSRDGQSEVSGDRSYDVDDTVEL